MMRRPHITPRSRRSAIASISTSTPFDAIRFPAYSTRGGDTFGASDPRSNFAMSSGICVTDTLPAILGRKRRTSLARNSDAVVTAAARRITGRASARQIGPSSNRTSVP